jgi:type IX secretion system PorP/SprF family membrane protein
MVINPAYAGSQVQLSATFINRNQWINIPGAPVTQTFSMHSGFFRSRVGVGLLVTRDVIGIHSDYGAYGVYSFNVPINKQATLALGIQAGFNHLSSNFDLLFIRNQTDPNLSGMVAKLNPNFGTGAYYYTKKIYLGISVPYLLENKIVDVESVLSEARQSRNYYAHFGMNLPLKKDFKLVPNILVRVQEGAPLGIDMNGTIAYKDIIGLGASYRSGDAIIFLFEIRLLDNLHMGYAYDYITSDLNKFSDGSHEIMINYRVKLGRIHKGLECPTYF